MQGTDTEAVILLGKTCTTMSSPPPLLLPAPDRKSAMKLADKICEHTVNTHHVVGRDAELRQGRNKGK